MYKYGSRSKQRLSTCHPDIQKVFNEAIKHMDITILCGERGEEEQQKAFESGNSKVQYPNSKHNTSPSIAIDASTYPYTTDVDTLKEMCWLIVGIAAGMGIKLRSGGLEWGWDYYHFELM